MQSNPRVSQIFAPICDAHGPHLTVQPPGGGSGSGDPLRPRRLWRGRDPR